MTNTLKVEPLAKEDHNRSFTCMAGNTNLSSPLETTVIVSVNGESFYEDMRGCYDMQLQMHYMLTRLISYFNVMPRT